MAEEIRQVVNYEFKEDDEDEEDENGDAWSRVLSREAFKRWKLPARIKHSCVLCASHKDNNSRLFNELAIKLPIRNEENVTYPYGYWLTTESNFTSKSPSPLACS
uniref:Uncharacterized protein n=1 Tax=Vespula pensylvanica TaxID=30213 RepID=A0A834P2U2_VESPE|nr:hypothetical protein H0235_007872 [Vespula pensylvanica]